jgi:hypothetical protein
MKANAIQKVKTLEDIQSIKLTFMKLPLWCRKWRETQSNNISLRQKEFIWNINKVYSVYC